MTSPITELAGLPTTIAGRHDARTAVALLHGHSMSPSDLAPFAHSLGTPALFLFPQGPVQVASGGYAWWPVDLETKARALQKGPRDLFEQQPAGLDEARGRLDAFLTALADRFRPQQIVLGGFSQGAMLACDWLMQRDRDIAALISMSASRLNFEEWDARHKNLAGLPVLASHGRHDTDLAFAAGERLRDFLGASGASVDWVPFDGGHEIPLIVWRRVRKLLASLP